MYRHLMFALLLAAVLTLPSFTQDSSNHDKSLDVRSSIGDLHVGKDADAQEAGLPLYPGARPKQGDNDSDPLNFDVLTQSFGLKLVVAKYESDDPPAKVIAFYRDKMQKYGKVLICDSLKGNGNLHLDDENDSSKPVQCDGDNTGPVKELKVGTEGNAHIVAVEPKDNGKGSSFALVYLRRVGKRGEI